MRGSLPRFLLLLALLSVCSASLVATEPDTVRSSVDLEIYGYIKVDAAYDSARTIVGEFVKWVDLVPGNPDDDVFSMTANQSRFGLRIGEPPVEDESPDAPGRVTRGRLEADFYGGGAPNKSRLMLRHAYLEVLWPDRGLAFLAGQTSDVISPLAPATLNYSVAWWAGNIGYRRPQLRVTKRSTFEEGSELVLSAALTRTIGATSSDFTGVDAGSDSGLPTLQARLGLGRPDGSTLGLSGHVGEEEYDTSATGDALTFDSWSANLDFQRALGPRVTLKAEIFTGANLAAYLGGIGQGVNLATSDEIESEGGWISLDVAPGETWTYHLGASLEDIDETTVDDGARIRNSSIFTSAVRSLGPHLQMGFELSRWATDTKAQDEATAVRSQFSVLYRF